MAQFKQLVADTGITKCNTEEEYTELKALYRKFVETNGPYHFKNNEKTGAKQTPIFKNNKVNDEELPFTFLGMMPKIAPTHPSQTAIPKHLRSRYAILQNRPEFGGVGPDDPHWETAKSNPKASMSAYHQFIGIRDDTWSAFNVLTFGEDPEYQSPAAVVEMLDELNTIAKKWASVNGVNQLGCFFHAFPFNSIQSLHMHMVDLDPDRLGAAWGECSEANLPLSAVRNYFMVPSSQPHQQDPLQCKFKIFRSKNTSTPESAQLIDILNQLCYTFYQKKDYQSCLGSSQIVHKRGYENASITVVRPKSNGSPRPEKCTNKSIKNGKQKSKNGGSCMCGACRVNRYGIAGSSLAHNRHTHALGITNLHANLNQIVNHLSRHINIKIQ